MTYLSELIGGDPVLITTSGGVPLVPATHVGTLAIRRGREATDQAPAATVLTFDADAASWHATAGKSPEISDDLVVDLAPAALTFFGIDPVDARRFGGTIADVRYLPKVTPKRPAGVYRITAAGPLSLLANRPTTALTRPQEADNVRADAILAEAAGNGPLFPYVAGYGSAMQLLPVAADQLTGRNADAQLAELCNSTGGDVWELRNGALQYLSATFRQTPDPTPAVTLSAGHVVSETEWQLARAGLLNRLGVEYGEPAATITVADDWSRTRYGAYASTLKTQLAVAGDAQLYASEQVSQRNEPRWSVPDLIVDLTRTVAPAVAAQLLQLQACDMVELVDLPAYVPPTAGRLFVEGWTETIAGRGFQLRLNVSDRALTGRPASWLDMPAGLTWLDVDATRSWLASRGYFPPN